MKIVHAADLHLDSPLRGLTRYEGAPEERIRGATRRALSHLVDLCIDEAVDLMLLAGDLFDGNWRDYSTGLFFVAEMSRLRAAGIRVVSLRGNHDAASQVTRHLRLPDNVVELSTDAPETKLYEQIGVAVHGQGFATRAVTEDLAATYPDAVPGLFNIGLLHTALGGRPGHEPYAPTNLQTLVGRGYDYWALGHVHTREVLCEDPYVVFCGNLQGRHARETGPKGATLLEVSDQVVTTIEHRVLDVVRWADCEIRIGATDGPEDAIDAARLALEQEVRQADGRLLCARVRLHGRTAASTALHREADRWLAEVHAVANDFGGEVWIEKVLIDTEPMQDVASLRSGNDALGQLLAGIASVREDGEQLRALLDELTDVRQALPAELRELGGGPALDDPAIVADALRDIEQILLVRLLHEERDR